MFACSISCDHLACSLTSTDANCCAEPDSGVMPCASSVSRTPASFTARDSASASTETTRGGTPAGAIRPQLPVTSNAGRPASANVGTSGRNGERAFPVCASARSLPPFTSGIAATLSSAACTSPATTPVSAGPLPW